MAGVEFCFRDIYSISVVEESFFARRRFYGDIFSTHINLRWSEAEVESRIINKCAADILCLLPDVDEETPGTTVT